MAGLTTDEIHAAADELDAQGIRPTLAAVRKKLGRGSFTTISDAMSSWRAAAAISPAAATQPLPEVVADRLETFAQQIWAAAVTAADEQVATERADLATERVELIATRDEAVALADAVTAELDQHKADTAERLAALTGDLDQAHAELDQARQLAEEYRSAVEAERVRAATLDGQLAALAAERDRLTADLATAQQQIGRLTVEDDGPA